MTLTIRVVKKMAKLSITLGIALGKMQMAHPFLGTKKKLLVEWGVGSGLVTCLCPVSEIPLLC